MHLITTLTNGKYITHVHGGAGHFYCGDADDIDCVPDVKHQKPTCKHCIDQIKQAVQVAKKYAIR